MFRFKFASFINKYFFYGWIIVIVSAIAAFFSSPGQTYSISAFIDSYIVEFGYSRTVISSVYSIATIISGFLLVFIGKAVDKLGQHFMLMVVGFMLSIACFFNSFNANIPMIFFGFFMLRYFGQGSLTLIPGSLVPQWFEKRRALALSLLTLGTILGNMLIPRFNVYLISTYSWNFTWRVWGVLLLVLFIPLMWLFIINKPEDIHLLPDNVKVKSQKELDKELDLMSKSSFTLQEAIRTKEFWFIGVISMIIPMISTGMMFHFYSIMLEKGINTESTAIVIGFMALPGLIMPLIAGTIIDKYRSRHIIFIALSCILLDMVFFQVVNSLFAAGAFLLIYGFFSNVYSVTLNVIWVKYFGRQYLGSIRGAATVFIVVGSAFGTVPFGMSFDRTGSYSLAFILMAVLTALGMALSLSIRKPYKD